MHSKYYRCEKLLNISKFAFSDAMSDFILIAALI